MDAVVKFARSVVPVEKKGPNLTKGLLMRIDPHVYVSLSSVAAVLNTSRGELSGHLLNLALQEFCDTLYQDRKDLSTGVDQNGIHTWDFYSPSVAFDLAQEAEENQTTFDFVGLPDEEEKS